MLAFKTAGGLQQRKTLPKASVIIVNYNGGGLFKQCVESVLGTDYPRFEIVVFDNHSSDGSMQSVQPLTVDGDGVRAIYSRSNIGFALANNRASRFATGEYLVLLNNDTVVEREWLRELILASERDSVGVCQSRLMSLVDRRLLDGAGDFPTLHGIPYIRGFGSPDRGYEASRVFSARGAALSVRKELFDRVGGMDDDFFFGNEDVDLCWRIRLAGYEITWAPKSIVYHYSGFTSQRASDLAAFHKHKNVISAALKNYDSSNVIRHVPLLLVFRLLLSLFPYSETRQVFGTGSSSLRAIFWVIKNFRAIYRKRLVVQNQIRRIPDSEALSLMPGLRFEVSLLLSMLCNRSGRADMWSAAHRIFEQNAPDLRLRQNLRT